MKNIFFLLILFYTPSFFSAFAGERIKSFDVNIEIDEDSSFIVTEKITYDFAGNRRRGIFRDIPLYYKRKLVTKWGRVDANYSIRLKILSVTDSNGKKITYKTFNKYEGVRIRIGSPRVFINGVKEYFIKYRVQRAINRLDSKDEFYWNVTGVHWSVPIKSASVSVSWPEGVKSLDQANFVGFYGSKNSVSEGVNLSDRSYSVSTKNLNVGEGLTVGVSFPKGDLIKPSKLQEFIWFLIDQAAILLFFPLPIFFFIFCYFLHKRKGTDPDHPDVIQARYDPPEGLNPAEVGALQDEVVETSDIVSTILDLAARGYLKILEVDSRSFLFLSRNDYKFVKRRSFNDVKNDLTHFELEFLNSVFATKDIVLLSELKNAFYIYLGSLKKTLYESLVEKKLFNLRPDSVRLMYAIKAVAFTVFLHLVIFIPLGRVMRPGLTPSLICSAFACLLISLFYARKMPRKTKKGVKLYYQILGFKEFVSRVEKPRLQTLINEDPNLFGRMLPYALVLGCADEWAEKFDGIITEPLDWYQSKNQDIDLFSAREFVHSMGEGINTMANTFQSTPPSSSSGGAGSGGGFSGGSGGFSGGGFGGGGGGSW